MPPGIRPLLARGIIVLLMASALWTGAIMSIKSGQHALKKSGAGKVDRAEQSLASLMPTLKGRRSIGLLSWYQDPAKLFEIQYVLAPILVRRKARAQDLLLVELGPGQRVDFNKNGWRLVARSDDDRYCLLSQAGGQGKAKR